MHTVDFDKLDIRPGAAILDVGCGSGRHLAAVCDMTGVTAVGVDWSRSALDETRRRLDYHREFGRGTVNHWLLAAADLTCLPFARNSFSHIICAEVLEHLADDTAALAELARILKPGGHLVISVPRFYPEWVCWALSAQYRQEEGGHMRIYRCRHLVEHCRRLGLHLWHRHWAHSLHVPYWWLKCIDGMRAQDRGLVKLYHRLLVWDMMSKPKLTQWLERLLNPVAGKSVVLYFNKNKAVKEA